MSEPESSPNAEILDFAGGQTLQNAKLEQIIEHKTEDTHELILEYLALELTDEPKIELKNGQLVEILQGHNVPYQLKFAEVRWRFRDGLYANLDKVPAEDDCRYLQGVVYWEKPAGRWGTPQREPLCIFYHNSWDARLVVCALQIAVEKRSDEIEPVRIERNWSSPPPISEGIAYWDTADQKEYGGDAIPVYMDGEKYPDLLFVGSLENQNSERPAVAAVLNLCEIKNPWLTGKNMPTCDRWRQYGEAEQGMILEDIVTEAEWTIERLRAKQKVLVHCEMGFNRSVTICCAVLILLEKISAEEALHRVREYHRWARPDAYHWLKLKWLAKQPLN